MFAIVQLLFLRFGTGSVWLWGCCVVCVWEGRRDNWKGRMDKWKGRRGTAPVSFFWFAILHCNVWGVHSLECYWEYYIVAWKPMAVRLFLNKADKQKTIYAKLQLAFEMLIAVCFNHVFLAVNIQNNLLIPNNLSNRQKSSTNRLNGCLRFMP